MFGNKVSYSSTYDSHIVWVKKAFRSAGWVELRGKIYTIEPLNRYLPLDENTLVRIFSFEENSVILPPGSLYGRINDDSRALWSQPDHCPPHGAIWTMASPHSNQCVGGEDILRCYHYTPPPPPPSSAALFCPLSTAPLCPVLQRPGERRAKKLFYIVTVCQSVTWCHGDLRGREVEDLGFKRVLGEKC